jgi:Zn-dependent peptidase ImmA (M78 family)
MNAEAAGHAAAERFRREHHLGVQPLGDLVAVIEQSTGIDVAVLDVGPDEHGLTIRDSGRDAVIIGVARTQNPMRQRSTLAHELCHVLLEDWADNSATNWSNRTPQEIRADAFARHLLVPIDGLREFLQPRPAVAPHDLSMIVQRFLVSPAIAAIALEQAGYISESTKLQWMSLSAPQVAARFGWTDQYQALQAASDRRRAPQRLLARAIRGYAEAVVTAQTIATLRGVPLDIAAAELREAGIVPVEHPIPWTDPAELPDVQVDLLPGTTERSRDGASRGAAQVKS